MTRTGILRSVLAVQQLDVHDIEGIYPLYQALLRRKQSVSDCESVAVRGQRSLAADSMQSLSTDAAPEDVCLGDAVTSSAKAAADAEGFDARRSLSVLPEAGRLAALRDYLTAATAKDCSVMIALQASRPMHVTPASELRFCGGATTDDGSSPAMGRFSTTEESSIAFKVRPP